MKLPSLYLFTIACLLLGESIFAQADISMATHWYNRANYNPASIARTDYLYLFSNLRNQWVGIDGAPKVFNVQASEYYHNLRSAFGLSIVGDKIGASQAYNPMLTYAYRIGKEQDWSLSMGIAGGVFIRFVDGSLFEADNIDDPSIQNDMKKIIQPDVNVGFEFQSANFIIGISSTHLMSVNKPGNSYLNTNHRYGYGIYKNSNSEMYNYNIGLQVVNRYNLTVLECNTTFRFKRSTGLINKYREIFDLGLTYRTSRQMTILFGLNISPNLRAGYAYDYSFIKEYNQNATHEILLEYRIPFKAASTRFHCGDDENWYH